MPIELPSHLQPMNGNSFYLVEDTFIKGGYIVVATESSRDDIPASNRKSGMLVYTQESSRTWKLENDLTTWLLVQRGLLRQTVTRDLAVGVNPMTFELALGASYYLRRVTTSRDSRVRVYVGASYRVNDLIRSYSTLATEDSGVVLDVLTTGGSTKNLLKTPFGTNFETPASQLAYITVQAEEGSLSVTFEVDSVVYS